MMPGTSAIGAAAISEQPQAPTSTHSKRKVTAVADEPAAPEPR